VNAQSMRQRYVWNVQELNRADARIAYLERTLWDIARREDCGGEECLECGVKDFAHGNCVGCLARAAIKVDGNLTPDQG
jgi:hypothetical protein